MSSTLTLGRDGLGFGATERDFQDWVAWVTAGIDDMTGLNVDVDTRAERDGVQCDLIVADGEDKYLIQDALVTLWESFCGDEVAA